MSFENKLEAVVKTAYQKYTSATKPEAAKLKAVVHDGSAPATAVLIAAKQLLGDGIFNWEPETLWLELGDVPLNNRDKLLSAISLDVYPSFYWDARVMGNTCLAFNDEAVLIGLHPHPSVHALAWGTLEAELIFGVTDKDSTTPVFDDECIAYAAVCLFDQGYAHAPEQLDFAEKRLRELLPQGSKALGTKVEEAWRDQKNSESFEDSALGVQLARLADVQLYLDNRLENLELYLAKL